jgi:MerR family transcriptional regulator, light-induced transcriptional regulator
MASRAGAGGKDEEWRGQRRDSGPIGLPEAAELLGVHYMTAYRYVRTGRLPATSVGGVWQVHPDDVLAVVGAARAPRRVQGGSRSRAATRLEDRLAQGDGAGAFAVCEEAMASWATPEDVYAEMVIPAMRSIGDRWERGEISVAVEHCATTAVVGVMGRLGPQFARRGRKRGTMVIGAPAGDRHSLPVTLVADMLRAARFDIVDLGGDTPIESFVDAARAADRLVAVAIGVTTPGNGGSVKGTVDALHTALPDTPVIVGGAAVPNRVVAARAGADQWSGTDGRRLVELVTIEMVERA